QTSPELMNMNKRTKTWKVSATKHKRLLYRLQQSAHLTDGTEPLSLPTPTTSQNHKPIRALAPSEANGTHGVILPGGLGHKYPDLIGKYINPEYLEWMMGFPIGW